MARFSNPFFRIIFIRYLSSFFGHFQLHFALSSPVWALSESHTLGEAASLEFNTFFWCCRLGSHDRPVPWPLTQLSFQPWWYNWGEMCENTKTGCNGRIVTAFINAAKKYYTKNIQIFPSKWNQIKASLKTTSYQPVTVRIPKRAGYPNANEFRTVIKTIEVFHRFHEHVRGREEQLGNAGKVGRQEEDTPDSRVSAWDRAGNKWSFRAEVSVVCVFALVHVCMYNHLLWLEARLKTWSSNAETVSGRVAATFLTVERKHIKWAIFNNHSKKKKETKKIEKSMVIKYKKQLFHWGPGWVTVTWEITHVSRNIWHQPAPPRLHSDNWQGQMSWHITQQHSREKGRG